MDIGPGIITGFITGPCQSEAGEFVSRFKLYDLFKGLPGVFILLEFKMGQSQKIIAQGIVGSSRRGFSEIGQGLVVLSGKIMPLGGGNI